MGVWRSLEEPDSLKEARLGTKGNGSSQSHWKKSTVIDASWVNNEVYDLGWRKGVFFLAKKRPLDKGFYLLLWDYT